MFKKNIKQNKLAIFGITLIVLLLVCLFGFSIFGNKNVKVDSENSTESLPFTQEETSPIETPDNSFKELIFDVEHSMKNNAGYFQLNEPLKWAKEKKESYNLASVVDNKGNPVKTKTGHKLYSGATNSMFIISGVDPVEYINGRIFGTDYLREEDTGVRIRTFNNEDEMNYFLQSYASGQRILAGETDADEGTVIVDGCYTNIKYVEKNGSIYFNIVDVLKQITPTSVYVEGSGSLHVNPNEFISFQIPTDAANYQLKKSLSVAGEKFTFRSWNGERFEYNSRVLNEKDMLICTQDANVMFGWKIYSNGKNLSIVSDELNVTDKAVVYSFDGDSGLVFKIEIGTDGKLYVNMYDNRGTLITSKPYEEGDSPQFIANGPEGYPIAKEESNIKDDQRPVEDASGVDTQDDNYSM